MTVNIRRSDAASSASGSGPRSKAASVRTSGATAPDRVIDELRQYDFEIISTNLPEEQEKQLREAFAQE